MLDVLNCKLGDLKLSFDKSNPVEAERARRAVTKMLRDGFVIFVEVGDKLRRVDSFDASCDCYVLTDVPGSVPAEADAPKPEVKESKDAGTTRQPGKRGPKQRVPAGKSRATAVAPRAGG